MPLQLSKIPPKEGQPLRVAYITWNLANKTPREDEVKTIIASAGDMIVDAIVIVEQEAPRASEYSLAGKIAYELEKNSTGRQPKTPKEALEGLNGHRNKFNTRTKPLEPGAVANTVLSHHPIQVSSGVYIDPSNSNKGGCYQTVNIAGQSFQTAGVHLESYASSKRMDELAELIAAMQPIVTKYADLVDMATTPMIIGGDLNYRDLLEQDEKGEMFAIDPMKSHKKPMQHFQLHGLQEAQLHERAVGELTYAGKRTHHESISLTADKKRHGDATQGKLDRVFTRGGTVKVKFEQIIEGTRTSDHKPVIAITEIPRITNEFLAVKHFVSNMMDSLTIVPEYKQSMDILRKVIEDLQDTPDSKSILLNICHHLERFKATLIELEKSRMLAISKPKQDPSEIQEIQESYEKVMGLMHNFVFAIITPKINFSATEIPLSPQGSPQEMTSEGRSPTSSTVSSFTNSSLGSSTKTPQAKNKTSFAGCYCSFFTNRTDSSRRVEKVDIPTPKKGKSSP